MGKITTYKTSENIIAGRYLGDEGPVLIELIRNGEIIDKKRAIGPFVEFTFKDRLKFDEVSLKTGRYKPFVYYYIKVLQGQYRITWASPVWIE